MDKNRSKIGQKRIKTDKIEPKMDPIWNPKWIQNDCKKLSKLFENDSKCNPNLIKMISESIKI